MKGRVFSIEEFAVYDGPGIRTAVFLKGCHLRCSWCHNPEGVSHDKEIIKSPTGCPRCRKEGALCAACKEKCLSFGIPLEECPSGIIRVAGTDYEADDLARVLLKNVDILNMNGGGITFTGGEPFFQSEFLYQVLGKLKGKTHLMIETCGYTEGETFKKIVSLLDMLIIDMKIIDPVKARKYEGVDNSVILKNYEILKTLPIPFIARVPLIPGVIDTEENITAIIGILKDAPNLEYVELLPYNKMAGSKHPSLGKKYEPSFNETEASKILTEPFLKAGLKVRVLS